MSNETPQVTDKRRFTEEGSLKDAMDLTDGGFSPSSDPDKPIGMDFSTAIKQVLKLHRVTRLEWENPDTFIFMFMWGTINPEVPAGKYLSIHHANGSTHPLYLSDGDLLADDWVIVV